jgi:hypothetical protein
MVRLGLMLAVVSLLAACESDPPPLERSELEQAAYALQQLQNGSDMFVVHFSDKWLGSPLIERMAWFREAIGTCDRFEPYRSHGPKRARFLYHCERGQLEAFIRLDDHGRVATLLTGARGVAPPAQVRAAAQRWLDSPAGEAAAKGCRIDRVDLGSLSGALFVLVCPTGEKTLKLELDRHGEVRHASVSDEPLDEWRVPSSVG